MRSLKRLLPVLVLLLTACAFAEPAQNIAASCDFIVSEDSPEALYDQNVTRSWHPSQFPAEARVRLPEGGAQGVRIDWKSPAENFTLTEYDADQNVLRTRSAEDEGYAFFSQYYDLLPETKYFFLNFNQPEQRVQELRIYSAGELPIKAVHWQAPYEKCDLLVLSAHQDDEWLWFGGIIPYYNTIQGKRVQVVYMCTGDLVRKFEALNANAVAHNNVFPVFMGYVDERGSDEQIFSDWGGYEASVDALAGLIRRCRPEVILTHDWNGEYGHPQHVLVSRMMQDVVDAAADPARNIDGTEPWQVKKLYRHLEQNDQIRFDWHIPYEEFDGQDLYKVVSDAFLENDSQLGRWSMENAVQYDNTLFGLSYSAIGPDSLHQDLFENIPDPTPEPTPEPTPTAEAAVEATTVPAAVQPQAAPRKGGTVWIIIAALLVCGAIAALLLYRRRQSRKRRRRRTVRR